MAAELLKSQPEIALFASLALGYLIGSFRFGPIQLGGVCGTLIVSLLLGQTGARLGPDLKNIAFALFTRSSSSRSASRAGRNPSPMSGAAGATGCCPSSKSSRCSRS